MDFIFMLTRGDATVADAFDLAPIARAAGVRHIGFKDVGVDAPAARRLAAAIRAQGATCCMEIVATSAEDECAAVALARDCGVDWLLGGVHVEAALAILAGSGTRYFPFAGLPRGHPTALDGDAALVEAQCRAFAAKGCAGVDILAFRAREAAPLDLVAACRRGFGADGRVIVAGSIDSGERVRAIREAGADAFTIGEAALAGRYAPGAKGLAAQLAAVLADASG